MDVSFGPGQGPQPERRDASSFFGRQKIFIVGADRLPLPLVGTLSDGLTPCSELQDIHLFAPEGDEIAFSQVSVNLPSQYLHPRKGLRLLDRLESRGESRTVESPKLKQLVGSLALLSEFYDVNFGVGREAGGSGLYLSLVKTFFGTEPGVLPAIFVQALSETLELIDSYLFRPSSTNLDAGALLGQDVLNIDTSVRKHLVALQGLIRGTQVRASIWDGPNVSIRVPAAEVDRLRGAKKLQYIAKNMLFHDLEFQARFEDMPFSFGSGEGIEAQVCGAWRKGGYERSYISLRVKTFAPDLEERRAIVVGALNTLLHFCDTYVEEELDRIKREETEIRILRSVREDISLDQIVRDRILSGGLYRIARAEVRPGVPHFLETDTTAVVRVEPVAMHPAVNDYAAREALVRDLMQTELAGRGGLIINFVETLEGGELPGLFREENILMPGSPRFYWQIMACWDNDTRAEQLTILDQFLAEYYLVLRTGITPEELDAL